MATVLTRQRPLQKAWPQPVPREATRPRVSTTTVVGIALILGILAVVAGVTFIITTTALSSSPSPSPSSQVAQSNLGADKQPIVQISASRTQPKTWKTIETGGAVSNYRNVLQELKSNDVRVDEANRFVRRIAFSSEKKKVNVVVMSVEELGYPQGANSLSDVYNAAKQFGCRPTSPEVAVRLRLQYLNQPRDEHLMIATAPIADPVGGSAVLFTVYNNSLTGKTLGLSLADFPVWSPKARFVFEK